MTNISGSIHPLFILHYSNEKAIAKICNGSKIRLISFMHKTNPFSFDIDLIQTGFVRSTHIVRS